MNRGGKLPRFLRRFVMSDKSDYERVISVISENVDLWSPVSWCETSKGIYECVKESVGKYPDLQGVDLENVDWVEVFDELSVR